MRGLAAALRDETVFMGYVRYVPLWAQILEAAAAWGIPPWRVVEECPSYWWTRWEGMLEAKRLAKEGGEADGWAAAEGEFRE